MSQIEFKTEEAVYAHYKKTDAKIIMHKGIVYDVSGYVSLHPGGQEFISDHFGKKIDDLFEE